MNPRDPRFSDEERDHAGEVADDETQRQIASLLRQSATDPGSATRMPASVEHRIKDALRLEATSREAASPNASGPSPVAPLPRTRHDAPTSIQLPGAAAPRRESQKPLPAASADGASVHSLDTQRRRRPRSGRIALALSAAAAVAIGAVGIVHSREGGSSPAPAAAASSRSAPVVQVTDSHTMYTTTDLKAQAAELPSSNARVISTEQQARTSGLGPMASKQGVRSCVEAIGAAVTDHPQRVWADFGTYNGEKAVVVLVEKGGHRTVWVVGRSCTAKSDVMTGPTSLPV